MVDENFPFVKGVDAFADGASDSPSLKGATLQNNYGTLNHPLDQEETSQSNDVTSNSHLSKGIASQRDDGISNKTKFITLRHDKEIFKLPFNPKLKARARELRKAGNLAEVLFWNEIKQNKLGFDFIRQQIIGNYIVDFYCPKLRLVIEIDGSNHDDKGEYDETREEYLKSLGLHIIHFLDSDVKQNLSGVIESLIDHIKNISFSKRVPEQIEEINTSYPFERVELNTPPTSLAPLLKKGEYMYLPIDTKYFKDLEIEVLSLFDNLDEALDGRLIHSENYQALNTLLPKFKEKVEAIYIDPPFNLDSSDQFMYKTNYKDANWATLLENRIRIAREWLNEKGSIFVRFDYNGNWIVRCLMDEIFGKENFRNEIILNRSGIPRSFMYFKFNPATYSLFLYGKTEISKIYPVKIQRDKEKIKWIPMHIHKENRLMNRIKIDNEEFIAPKGRHFPSQNLVNTLFSENRIKILEKEYVDVFGNKQTRMPYYLPKDFDIFESNWTDIPGYSQTQGFSTENSAILLKRVTESTSYKGDLIMDFFLGSGTTTAVAHKLGRKWIGVEMGEHFYTVVLPRMKKVLFYDKSGISKEKDVKENYNKNKAGGFFKYYDLKQYEDTLRNMKYKDYDQNELFADKKKVF